MGGGLEARGPGGSRERGGGGERVMLFVSIYIMPVITVHGKYLC